MTVSEKKNKCIETKIHEPIKTLSRRLSFIHFVSRVVNKTTFGRSQDRCRHLGILAIMKIVFSDGTKLV